MKYITVFEEYNNVTEYITATCFPKKPKAANKQTNKFKSFVQNGNTQVNYKCVQKCT